MTKRKEEVKDYPLVDIFFYVKKKKRKVLIFLPKLARKDEFTKFTGYKNM